MGSLITIVIRRVAANARLLAAVVIGAILAAAIMSTTAIYTDAIRDLGLAYAIRERGIDEINLVVRSTSQSSQPDSYSRNQEFIESAARSSIGPIIDGQLTNLGRSATFFPTAPGQQVPVDEGRPRSHLQFVTGIDRHVNVIEGQLPGNATGSPTRAPTIEVAVGSETASRLNIRVGSEFDLHPFWRPEAAPVRARVTGIIEPKDQSDEFWAGHRDLFSFPGSNWDTIPFFITRDTFFQGVAAYLPNMTSDFTSVVYVETADINARNAESVRTSLLSYSNQLGSNILRTSVTTALPSVLETYDEKLFFTRIPLLMLVLQIAAIVIYYLYMVSTMLVERQAGEIALLKSRGATTGQVMRVYVAEGFAIMLFALALGPPLAAIVISLLGQTPPFADLSGGSNLQVNLSPLAYAWAAGGAVLAFVTLLLPAYQATRRTVVQQRVASARPPKQPVFTRYYLDLVLVGIGGFLLYQLNRRGSLVAEDFFGEQSVDPVVLLTPAFFILTVGIVFLRLFPLALRLLAWMVAKAQGAAIIIGMWQLVRNPVHYSRLVLLLMLATAVGMFAASFGATLDRSYADRASYQSGAMIRISELRQSAASGPTAVASAAQEQFGAKDATEVYRLSASQGSIANRTNIEILGVDPEKFGEVAFFREDFADASLQSLLDKIQEEEARPSGLELPGDARWLGIWINPVEMPGRFGLEMEVRDASGRYFSYNVGPDDVVEMAPGWHLLVSDLSRPGSAGGLAFRPQAGLPANGPYPAALPQSPLTLTSLSLRSPTRFAAPSGAIQFDDLHVTSAASIGAPLESGKLRFDPERALGNLPGAQVVADFDSVSGWQPVQGVLPQPLNDQTRTVTSGGHRAIELRWTPQQGQISTHGLRANANPNLLPVLASVGFLQQSGLTTGDTASLFVNSLFIDVEIVGSFSLFPTLNDARRNAAMIVNGRRLAEEINANPRGPLTYPGEIWLDGGSQTVAAARQATTTGALQASIVSFEELREAQQSDPLIAAGWEGILFISFAAILLLSAIGFLIYSYLTAQRRTLEFAVLRTMGFSKKQIAMVVAFEQFFVIGLGMFAGTLMGMRLGSLMIRYMGLTETGEEVLPPMELQISWLTIGSAWLVLGAVFLVTIAAVVLLYSRLALHRVLRIGEA
jgi:ABC-type antimicrobial peptide transport system permease subunit